MMPSKCLIYTVEVECPGFVKSGSLNKALPHWSLLRGGGAQADGPRPLPGLCEASGYAWIPVQGWRQSL